MSCGCSNWWNNFPRSVCGTWDVPEVEDQGSCSSRRVKITCDAPALPIGQCADTEYEVIYQPANTSNPFAISARLFDECCEAFFDETDDPITLILVGASGAPDGVCPP